MKPTEFLAPNLCNLRFRHDQHAWRRLSLLALWHRPGRDMHPLLQHHRLPLYKIWILDDGTEIQAVLAMVEAKEGTQRPRRHKLEAADPTTQELVD